MTLPLDFTAYLSERLGVGANETITILGTWLREYEPLDAGRSEHPSVVNARRPSAEPADELRVSA